MAGYPHPWAKYSPLQQELDNSTRVSDRNWGVEEALNTLLDVDAPVTDEEIDRVIAAGSRRERAHARLRKTYLLPTQQTADGDFFDDDADAAAIMARLALNTLANRVGPVDFDLLCATAEGHSYGELALEYGCSAGALRTRVARLRAAHRDLVDTYL